MFLSSFSFIKIEQNFIFGNPRHKDFEYQKESMIYDKNKFKSQFNQRDMQQHPSILKVVHQEAIHSANCNQTNGQVCLSSLQSLMTIILR